MEISSNQSSSDLETAVKLGLLPSEFEEISRILGRTPNFTELSIYSVMWSEHCSYKNSIKWLKTLPREGSALLAKAGEENAGLVDIGDGLACAFKIESHNHPSALEPYQGAATGVGGINRDIFTMGARPIAQLNSLRFGDLSKDHTQWLIKGVVKGIGDYGNAFGVPTVGGEVFFDPCFQQNPLVNAMSVGIVKVGATLSAIAEGEGNPVFIVGSSTGRDGIHGATFASADLNEDSVKDLPAVQVGDPFAEKLLLEASLELASSGAVVGMQDMGAAGITCSTSEMSAKGNAGMMIWLDKVPLRQEGMKPFEILLSESQERMLVVVKKGREQDVLNIFEKWDIHCAQIGVVTSGGMLEYFMGGECVAKVPAQSLVLGGGAPVYEREFKEPDYFLKNKAFRSEFIDEPADYIEVARFLASHPNIASKQWIFNQYDSMVGTINMTTNFPSDASVVDIRGTNKALAMTVDCNSRYVWADPEAGCAIAVAEAARNLSCSGAKPLGVTNCLNFGNPYNPEVYWQFVHSIKGMGNACRVFDTPVTGGNVSFYNQSSVAGITEPVFPTPTIGMIGMIEDKTKMMGICFTPGKKIAMLGEICRELNCSEYLYSFVGVKHSPAPTLNLELEIRVHNILRHLISHKLISSAHDCSEGGLFIALLECALNGKVGCKIQLPEHVRKDFFLFGESQGRVVVSYETSDELAIIEACSKSGVPFIHLGETFGNELIFNNQSFGKIEEYRELYQRGIAGQLS
ncbi:MAG: phosphoribosylformylglycinamidine synthase subunit PurL [Bacteroidota bacterium]|jgi:phosphoribosylformylglycinamidine synthase